MAAHTYEPEVGFKQRELCYINHEVCILFVSRISNHHGGPPISMHAGVDRYHHGLWLSHRRRRGAACPSGPDPPFNAFFIGIQWRWGT